MILGLHEEYLASHGSSGANALNTINGCLIRVMGDEQSQREGKAYIIKQVGAVVLGDAYSGFSKDAGATTCCYIRTREPYGRDADQQDPHAMAQDYDLASVSNSPFTFEEFEEWLWTEALVKPRDSLHSAMGAGVILPSVSEALTMASLLGSCTSRRSHLSARHSDPESEGSMGGSSTALGTSRELTSKASVSPTSTAGGQPFTRETPQRSLIEKIARRESIRQLSEKGTVFPKQFEEFSATQLKQIEQDMMDYLEVVRDAIKDNQESCVVCLNHPPTVIFYPCKHKVICRICALGCQRCPLCRSPFERMFEVNEQ